MSDLLGRIILQVSFLVLKIMNLKFTDSKIIKKNQKNPNSSDEIIFELTDIMLLYWMLPLSV